MSSYLRIPHHSPFRVGTWNIYGARRSPVGITSITESARIARAMNLDFLLLQEIEFEDDGLTLATESQELVDKLGFSHKSGLPLSPSQFSPTRKFGNAILSRYPLTSPRRFLVPNPSLFATRGGRRLASHDKGFVCVDAYTPLGLVSVASIHLLPFHMFDVDPSKAPMIGMWTELAIGLEKELLGRPFVVGGDFNTNDRSVFLSKFLEGRCPAAAGGAPTRPGKDRSFDDLVTWPGSYLALGPVIPGFSDHHLVTASVWTR